MENQRENKQMTAQNLAFIAIPLCPLFGLENSDEISIFPPPLTLTCYLLLWVLVALLFDAHVPCARVTH